MGVLGNLDLLFMEMDEVQLLVEVLNGDFRFLDGTFFRDGSINILEIGTLMREGILFLTKVFLIWILRE